MTEPRPRNDHRIHNDRLGAFRDELKRRDLQGFVVAHTDEHTSEYTPAYAQRLAWLTGFDGSAGLGVVLDHTASIYVDGRYTLQVKLQVDGAAYEFLALKKDAEIDWIVATATPGSRIGFDPWLHTEAWAKRASAALEQAGLTLVAVDRNPIDAIWSDQPERPQGIAVPHVIDFTGEESLSKRQRLSENFDNAHAAVITALDSIAWLLNIRGSDVDRTPLVTSFAILHKNSDVDLYIDPIKVTDDLTAHLGAGVRLHNRADFVAGLKALAAQQKTVLVDQDSASAFVIRALDGATLVLGRDPCLLPKARKNTVEIDGTRRAHVRDGAALTSFLGWLAANAQSNDLDELKAAAKLYDFRKATGVLKDLSFDSISGAGPNGAVVHYRVTEASNRPIKQGELFLIDSGGQYLDGTTDVTRTIAVGHVGAEEKDRFTRVLKGHIAIATARFPKGTSGAQLDALARMPLWQAGLNYDHGTGHGVGSYLSVHEGPQRISSFGSAPLEPGMIVSNEPGYYKTDRYGIRIENLVVVKTADDIDGDIPVYEFETLTLAPIDINLVERSLLTDAEAAWLNAYHARVRDTLTTLVDEKTAVWLESATQAI